MDFHEIHVILLPEWRRFEYENANVKPTFLKQNSVNFFPRWFTYVQQ